MALLQLLPYSLFRFCNRWPESMFYRLQLQLFICRYFIEIIDSLLLLDWYVENVIKIGPYLC